MMRWALAFLFTQAVEMPIYVLALLRSRRKRASSGSPETAEARGHGSLARATAIAFGASAITHPIVWFVVPRAWVYLYLFVIDLVPSAQIRSPLARYVAMAVLAESFAIVVEAVYLRAAGLGRAWAWAFVANMASVSLGLASRAVFGLP